ncbi:lipocalin family protein [Gelidibacter maritimus]|uniref:Lipocalin family protein n=1 Tax=Gelidibacter maritimus TaxID=2761487 RepID=A0A7W2M2J2_9FLAO|nr:lipocalin family protein [Gelidibacter maritimus]MBA6151539.1 lipocalin family protein [Gelidibacter maritimus]
MLKRYLLCLLGCCLFLSCSTDDDGSDGHSNFYSGAKTSVKTSDLVGTWTIMKIGFKNQIADVPVTYRECGRDFVVFSGDDLYTEYLFQSSDCQFVEQTLNFALNNGVITLTNSWGQSDDLVVTQVSADELVFKSRLDIDDDGKLDIVVVYLKRYVPTKFDMVSKTFNRNPENSHNVISFTWQPYFDAQSFVAYEVYRSAGPNASKGNAVLIETITDINTTEFTDLTPPAEERLGYYLKTKVSTGTLGESYFHTLDTYTLEATPVNLYQPEVAGTTILLNWEESEMPYFSHYEISYSNFPAGYAGYGKQMVSVAKISDRGVTSFIDENPPFLKNPVYSIRVYDIFGNKTYPSPQDYTTAWEVNYQKEGLLPLHRIASHAIDPTEPIIYFYGNQTEGSYKPALFRYNYETMQMKVVTENIANTSTDLPIKIVTSSHGKELLIGLGNDLHVYDAANLDFKYVMKPNEIRMLNDFGYSATGYWILTDFDTIYSFKRNGSSLSLVDSKPHFTTHQSVYNYNVLEIENNQWLVGHKNETSSMLYTIANDGQISFDQTVSVPIKNYGGGRTQFNAAGHYLINFEDRQLYSTLDFSSLQYFQHPYTAFGLSVNGHLIYGTSNDPEWSVNETSAHIKEAVIYNRNSQQVQKMATLGYPLFIFENFRGEVISISSGLKKAHLRESLSYTTDLFIERLDLP